MALLEIRNLSVSFATSSGAFKAVDGVDLDVDAGEVVAIVGESGSGKSVAMLAVMGLLPNTATVTAERLAFEDIDLLALSSRQRRRVIGKEMAMIFQEPIASLNPCFNVGFQIGEALKAHLGMDKASPPGAQRRTPAGSRNFRTGAAAVRLSAPTLGRHEPARNDRNGACLPPQAAHRRRADNGA
jgi:ABC-type dipeptide/oligopeptide/nickel transport system ATPase component